MDRIANEIQKKKERENRELDQEKRKKMVTKIVSMKECCFLSKDVVSLLIFYFILWYQSAFAIIWVHIPYITLL